MYFEDIPSHCLIRIYLCRHYLTIAPKTVQPGQTYIIYGVNREESTQTIDDTINAEDTESHKITLKPNINVETLSSKNLH